MFDSSITNQTSQKAAGEPNHLQAMGTDMWEMHLEFNLLDFAVQNGKAL